MKIGDLVMCINPHTGFNSIGVVTSSTEYSKIVYTFVDKREGAWTRGYVFPLDQKQVYKPDIFCP